MPIFQYRHYKSVAKLNNKNFSVHHQTFKPSQNSQCLCGSGEKFKRCCSEHYEGRVPGKRTRAALNDKDYLKALLECRADITQYTIWHKTNTAPYIKNAPEVIQFLLEIDINALSELVQLLYLCYSKAGLSDQFSAAVELLRSNIEHPRWQRKIVYFHAINALGIEWDERAGRRELKKLGSMKSETDVEIPQLYIDLFRAELSFSEKQELIDRIISLAKTQADKLHYRGLKGMQYLMVGDQPGAERELDVAINSYRSSMSAHVDSVYEKYRFAMCMAFLGKLRNDIQLLDEAIEVNISLIESNDLTELGKANIYREIGDTYRAKGQWDAALKAYQQAISNYPSPIDKVFLAQCLLQTNELTASVDSIQSIDLSELKESEYVDYAFIYALISIESGDKKLMIKSETILRKLTISTPFFRELKDTLLLEVIDIKHNGTSNAAVLRVRKILRSIMSMTILIAHEISAIKCSR